MDPRRFDSLTRSLVAAKSRRGFLGSVAALTAGLAGSRAAEAQVSQAQCGNVTCKNNPGKCNAGCVCCVYGNGNSRCRPPGNCAGGAEVCPPGQVVDPALGCVTPATTTTAAPATTTTTTTAAPATTTTTTTTTTSTTTTTTTTMPPLNTNPDPTCAGANGCAGDQECGLECSCGSTIEGGGVCYAASNCPATSCASSAECAEGSYCMVLPMIFGCCLGAPAVCVPRCGTAGFAATEARLTSDGPTVPARERAI